MAPLKGIEIVAACGVQALNAQLELSAKLTEGFGLVNGQASLKECVLPTAEAFRAEKPTSQSRLRRASSPFMGAKTAFSTLFSKNMLFNY